MVKLEPIAAGPIPRLWLVFFNDGVAPSWWSILLLAGFRHCCAASFYSDQQRWVYVNPSRHGTVIEVMGADEFGPRFQQLMTTSTVILRVRSQHGRRSTPATFHCVGALKALIGVRCRALTPYGLFRHLIRHGAEEVERADVGNVRRRPSEGRSVDCGGTREAAEAR